MLLAAVVAAVALSVVAVAYGTTRQTQKSSARGGACGVLMSNPQALQEMQALRVEHQQEMQAWSDQFGSDPSGAEAQTALQTLRQEHWNDMRELFKKYGITPPKGSGPGAGQKSGACGGACGGAGGTQGTGCGNGMMGSGGGMMGGGSY
jgi:hypothetical protein